MLSTVISHGLCFHSYITVPHRYSVTILHSLFKFSLINKFTITFCLCNPQLLNLPHLIILYPLISSLYSNLLPLNLLLLCFYKFLYKLLFRKHVCSVISQYYFSHMVTDLLPHVCYICTNFLMYSDARSST